MARVSAEHRASRLKVATGLPVSPEMLRRTLVDPSAGSAVTRLLARALHCGLCSNVEASYARGQGLKLCWQEGQLKVSRDFQADHLELSLPLKEPLPQQRCRFLRTHWLVNGRPLRCRPDPTESWYHYRSQPFLLGRRLLSGQGLYRVETAVEAGSPQPAPLEGLGLSWQRHYQAYQGALYWHAQDTAPMEVFCVSGSYLGPWSTVIEIPLELSGPSQVVVVKHGVCLEPIPFELGCPSAIAYLGGDDQATDLSGLAPVLDARLEQRLQRLPEQVNVLLGQVRAGMPMLRPRSGGPGPGLAAVRSVVGGVLAVTAALGEPLSMAIIGLSLGALVPTARRLRRERGQSNREELRMMVEARLKS